MRQNGYAIGQAVFLRTDTPDYAEETRPFRTLEELVRFCSTTFENLILDKVVVFSLAEGEPCAVTLGFMAASRGQKPTDPGLWEHA